MTKITYITVCWNAESVVKRTLDSVERQDYPEIEHLIIDGASTDGTLQLAKDYQAHSHRPVSIVSEPDKGIYDAMNKGLQLATGDYVCFLNAGDTLPETGTASTVAQTADASHAAVVYGDTDIVDDEGHFLRHRRLVPPEHLTWRSFRQGMLVCHQAFYARTDIAQRLPYNLSYCHSADVDWCIRVMKEAERRHQPLTHAHAVVAYFLDGGNTTRHHRASLRERFTVMRHHYGLATTLVMHGWFLVRAILKK